MTLDISGRSAAEIAESVRTLHRARRAAPGDPLPPVRVARRRARREPQHRRRRLPPARAGRRHRHARPRRHARRRPARPSPRRASPPTACSATSAPATPTPTCIPDPSRALASMAGRPVLYGEPVIDPDLERWAQEWMRDGLPPTVDDAAHHHQRRGRRRRAAARPGAHPRRRRRPRGPVLPHEHPHRAHRRLPPRAGAGRRRGHDASTACAPRSIRASARSCCTPRAQNPTGASLSARRAAELRGVLRRPPLRARDRGRPLLAAVAAAVPLRHRRPSHRRWALVRSVSKFLGPDMCLAVTASDPETAERLAMRLTPGHDVGEPPAAAARRSRW